MASTMEDVKRMAPFLPMVLYRDGHVGSIEEAQVLTSLWCEQVVEQQDQNETTSSENNKCHALQDILGVDATTSQQILQACLSETRIITELDDEEEDDTDSTGIDLEEAMLEDDREDDTNTYVLSNNECSICQRSHVPITLHHLIPKSTWKYLVPKLQRALYEIVTRLQEDSTALYDDENYETIRTECLSKAEACLGEARNTALIDVLVDDFGPQLCRKLAQTSRRSSNTVKSRRRKKQTAGTSTDTLLSKTNNPGGILKAVVLDVLRHHTAPCCRACHSKIHDTFDARTLAYQYNTVDRLLLDNDIVKFAKWKYKQRS